MLSLDQLAPVVLTLLVGLSILFDNTLLVLCIKIWAIVELQLSWGLVYSWVIPN
jgi:hypothetical protein